MTLTVAVQMDPLESIGIAGDSTFALMLGAQARGHKLFHYLADALTYAGRPCLRWRARSQRPGCGQATTSPWGHSPSSISARTSMWC